MTKEKIAGYIRADIGFWQQFAASPPEEQKQLLRDEKYRRIKQAHALGMQYYCFNCLKSCPVGQG
jgi:epoxyqueuosine reductase